VLFEYQRFKHSDTEATMKRLPNQTRNQTRKKMSLSKETLVCISPLVLQQVVGASGSAPTADCSDRC